VIAASSIATPAVGPANVVKAEPEIRAMDKNKITRKSVFFFFI
jgi:hypothetical protein